MGMDNLASRLFSSLSSLRKHPSPDPIRTYFSLEIQPEQQRDETEDERLYTIEENKNYRAVVKSYIDETFNKAYWDNHWREFHSHHWQEGQQIQTDGTLFLRCVRVSDRKSSCPFIKIEQNGPVVAYNEIAQRTFSHSFLMAAVEECETEDLIFELYYQPHAHGQGRQLVAQVRITLQGRYYPVDLELFKKTAITREVLRRPLPENTCIVYATSENEEDDDQDGTAKTVLQCWSRIYKPLERKTIAKTPIKMKDFNDDKIHDLAHLLARLHEYSSLDAKDLKKWLARQWRQLAGEKTLLKVIIVDYNLYQTPWEALELDDRVYLGAEAYVVRWMPVPSSGENDYRYYDTDTLEDISANESYGSVLAYIDAEDKNEQEVDQELDALTQINAMIFSDIAAFKDRLLKPLQDIHFVYIGAHGNEGNEFGSKKRESERVTRDELWSKIPEDGQRPLFFLNTCHSVVLETTKGLGKVGLLTVIMERMAGGYIGTLGAVGRQLAREVGHDLITQALQPDGILIPEFLRALREKVVRKIRAKSYNHLTKQQKLELHKEFFYTFMYVYYGNLRTRLRLLPARLEVEEVDHATGTV